MNRIQAAATLTALPGKEAEFEAALLRFFQRSYEFPGMTGAHLIKPAPGSDSREYGILRSFDCEEAMDAFYKSDLFKEWQKEAITLSENDLDIRKLHGLEAFFRGDLQGPPPRWKMAVITWLGVYPTVLIWSTLVRLPLHDAPPPIIMGAVSVLAVPTLTWGVMPILTKVFRGWLRAA